MANLALPQDFKELLKLLIDQKVEFLIVGGYAVTFHGHPRYTGDLDIWVNNSKDNARKIVSVLRDFGFNAATLTEDLFTAKDSITRMGIEPMKVEFFTHIPGVSFEDCYCRKIFCSIDEVGNVPFICLEDLKINKKASARSQDIADLEKLP